MATDEDTRSILRSNIEAAARRVVEGRMPAAWAGEQLAGLVRFWGYAGLDWPMPAAFEEFDHVMTDLECFPDGRLTTEDDIRVAARKVLAMVRDL